MTGSEQPNRDAGKTMRPTISIISASSVKLCQVRPSQQLQDYSSGEHSTTEMNRASLKKKMTVMTGEECIDMINLIQTAYRPLIIHIQKLKMLHYRTSLTGYLLYGFKVLIIYFSRHRQIFTVSLNIF